jgi:hypothetical protein
MTVYDRWYRIALIKAALDELSAHVPAIRHTARELEQIGAIAHQIQDVVTDTVREMPATFNIVCHLLNVDPAIARRTLRI